MDTISELQEVLKNNSLYEDSFIVAANKQIESYANFIEQIGIERTGNKRITMYAEDIPLYKSLANMKI